MRLVSFIVFAVTQIVFVPLALVGLVLVTYKQMVISKRLGVSQTGIEVLNGRWTMHVFGIRDDVATARLAGVLPNTSTFGLWLILFPLWLKYRISGECLAYPRIPKEGTEALGDLVVARTLHFDRIIRRVVGDVQQFVLLGAGYDTRAYGELKGEGLAFFELDQPTTQKLKIASLRKSGIDTAHVTFVPVDFSNEQAFERLQASGYDPMKRTLFLWEGVTLYLDETNVRKALRDIRGHAAPGSVVVADFYGERMIRIGSRSVAKKAGLYTRRFWFWPPVRKRLAPFAAVAIEHLGGAVGRVGERETAISHRRAQHSCLVLRGWREPAASRDNVAWARGCYNVVEPFLEQGVYVNYLGEEGESRVRAAYGVNYQRLAALKQRYDPTNLFRGNQNIRPATEN